MISKIEKLIRFIFAKQDGNIKRVYFFNILLLWAISLTVNAQLPTISSFTPTSGNIGISVTISGTNFNTTPTNNIVYFGGVKASVSSASTTSLTVTVPNGALPEIISVTNTASNLTAYSKKQFVPLFDCGGGVLSSTMFNSSVAYSGAYSISTEQSLTDIDGDGKLDIVAAKTDTILVYRNTSTVGNFSLSNPLKIVCTGGIISTTSADFNGDGKMDIAVCSNSDYTFKVLKNTSTVGSISFAAAVSYSTLALPSQIEASDINMDGKPEILIRSNNSTSGRAVCIYPNSSNVSTISFGTKTEITLSQNSDQHFKCGDFNNDGKPDLAILYSLTPQYAVRLNTSAGSITFGAEATYTAYKVEFGPDKLDLGDVDGDGILDAVVLASENINNRKISIFRNTGAGSFAARVDIFIGNGQSNINLTDLDGDGKLDIVAGGTSYSTIFKNNSTSGTISFGSDISIGSASSVQCGDMDGDKRPDLVSYNEVSYNKVFSPVISSYTNGTICTSGSTTISATPSSGTVSWYDASSGGTLLGTGNNFTTPNLTSTTIYYAEVSDGACTNPVRQAVTATVVTSLIVNPVTDKFYCQGSFVSGTTFSSTPSGATYSWTNSLPTIGLAASGTGNQPSFTATGNGVATIDVTPTLNGCIGTTLNYNVTIYPQPSVSAGINKNVCEGDSVLIGASPVATNGTPPYTYTWSNPSYLNNKNLENPYTNATLPIGNTNFYVFVRDQNSCTNTSNTITVTKTALPTIPNATAASSIACNSFSANWDAVSSATEYYIDVSTDAGFTSILSGYNNLNVGNVLTYLVNGLNTSTTYYFRVRAGNYCNISTVSNVQSLTTTNTVPSPPNSSAATLIDYYWFTANWNYNINASDYYLDVATDAGFTAFVTGYNNLYVGNTNAYLVNNLTPNTTYYYRLRSNNDCGLSINSSSINLTTKKPVTFSPLSGPVGSTVIISGSGFSTTLANNLVYFGAAKATVTAATTTQLTVTVPNGATYEPIRISNKATGNVYKSLDIFNVTFNCGVIDASLLNNATGLTVGTNALMGYAFADLDADGKNDFVITDYTTSTIYIRKNSSTAGSVSWTTSTSLTANNHIQDLAIADLDGDGNPDVIGVEQLTNVMSIYKHSATATSLTFGARQEFATNSSTSSYRIGVADLDDDGKLDVILSNSGYILFYRNTSVVGTISLDPYISLFVSSANGVYLTDFDGDLKTDLAINSYGKLKVYRNISSSGNILFDATPYTYTTTNSYGDIMASDIDGDGKKDAVLSNSTNNKLYIFRNTSSFGNINFDTPYEISVTTPAYFTISDIEGNGVEDIICRFSNNKINIYQNNSTIGNISFNTPVELVSNIASPRVIIAGDIDSDGKPDITYVNNTCTPSCGYVGFYLNATVSLNASALAANGLSCYGFTANWSTSSGATSYYLDVATDAGFTTFVVGYNNLNVGNVTSLAISGLTYGTTYYYRVRATNGTCISSSSSTINATTSPAPNTPTAIAASLIDCNSFRANWNAAANALGYVIDINTDASFIPGSVIYQNLNVGNVTNYTVTGLNNNVVYYYRIRAYNNCDTTVYSSVINLTTLLNTITTPGANSASSISSSSFTANWGTVANASFYYLDVSTDSNFTAFVTGYNNLNVGNVAFKSVTGLNPCTNYYYRIRAGNNCLTTPNSNFINVALSNPTLTSNASVILSTSSFQANWTALTGGASTYYLDISTNSGFTSFVVGYNNLNVGNVTSYIVNNLGAGTYYYRVRAFGLACNALTASSSTQAATLNITSQTIANYCFTQTNTTYTPLTGGTLVASGTSPDDNVYSGGLSIGFNFYFRNSSITNIGRISSNGFVTLGGTVPAANLYTPISASTTYTGAISAWGADLAARLSSSEIRTETIGAAPYRVYVVQYKDWCRFSGTKLTDQLNFQIRLYETSNIIEIVYGSCTAAATSTNCQVGVRGASNSDFKNVTGTWSTPVSGTLNSDILSTTSVDVPANGLTLRFTPVPAVTTPLSDVSLCPGTSGNNISKTILNAISGEETWSFPSGLTFTPDPTPGSVMVDLLNPANSGIYTLNVNNGCGSLTLSANLYAGPRTFVVSNTSNSGAGSLRQAITDANTNCTHDTIIFDLGISESIISPASTLPNLSDTSGVTINGFNNSGNNGTPNTIPVKSITSSNPFNAIYKVSLTNTSTIAAGLVLSGNNNVIKGLNISGFCDGTMSSNDINITISGNNNKILGCTINNVNPLHTPFSTYTSNASILISGQNNQIGDGTPGGVNIIKGYGGYGQYGVVLSGINSLNNIINGNIIGHPYAGSTEGLNCGIYFENSAGANMIMGNVISGNYLSGVQFLQAGNGSEIKDNIVGLTTEGLYMNNGSNNQINGIIINNASNITIGSNNASELNIISGNEEHGIYLSGLNCFNNIIKGNLIGTDPDSLNVTGANQDYGIYLDNGANNNFIGTINSGNYIKNNLLGGIYLLGDSTSNNKIFRNCIFENNGKPITLNDTANFNKKAPVITELKLNYVKGISEPNDTIELYKNSNYNNYDAKKYLGTAVADTIGNWIVTGLNLNKNDFLLANATDTSGNTSEFSISYYFWINGTGDWNDASHWSDQSGGISGLGTPNQYNQTVFDSNSIPTHNTIVNVPTGIFKCYKILMLDINKQPTIKGSGTLIVKE